MSGVPAATLPGPGRTIVVEPLEVPREAPAPSPSHDDDPPPARPAEPPVEEPARG
jgi:hypothetical protein